MSYETKLIIGQLGSNEKGKPFYFLRMTELNLCKCGYESEIYNMGTIQS